MLRNHSVERAVSRMTLNSDPLDDGIIYAEELPKEEMHVMSAMEIPGLIESHGETGLEKEISLRLHVVREQSLGRISSFISTLPTVGRYLEGAISVPSRNPDFFKTVINDVSLNAALIANGKEEKEVDRGRLNADLTKMNDYERLVRRQEVVLRRVRGRNNGVNVSDIEDIIGSYEQGPGV
ncbi:DEKNAAC102251 [Brettanomyces naardenensis]|uniref:DEKNAAC102251 n=1 Tax=Brettanomyces naardenensis TaxID=13370 RepID=A0A448YLT2_BRENA|nr:DEKNAAC102251 [Brettanomyces naardenensis]